MLSFTSRNFEAAILDQRVAGVFLGKRYAFVVVFTGERTWGLGVAVQDEAGYNPIKGKEFKSKTLAQEWADGLNQHMGHKSSDVIDIITSTMRTVRSDPLKW